MFVSKFEEPRMFGLAEDSLPIKVKPAFAAFAGEGASAFFVPCLDDTTKIIPAARAEDGFVVGVVVHG